MNFERILKSSFSRVFRNPIKCLALLVIIAVSACFGLITVISFSQMPDSVQDFPVALVNNDTGTIVNGEKINYGQKILEQTEDNNSVKWEVCPSDTFNKGIQSTRYYAAFIIPEDFSEKVMSAQSGTPVQADIIYLSNMRNNFLFSQMTNNIKNEFQHTITQFISDAYVTSTFDILNTLSNSLEAATEGSGQLEAASGQIGAGLSQLYAGTYTLTTGTSQLNDAGTSLAKGISALNQAVSQIDISQIQLSDAQKDTLKKTAADSQQVKTASQQLSLGIGSAISTSVKESLTSNVMKNTISTQLLFDSNIQAMITALQEQGYSKEQAEALINSIVSATLNVASNQITSENISSAVSETVSAAMGTVSGESALSGAQTTLKEVNTSLSASEASFRQLQDATSDLNAGADSLSSGITQLDANANDLKTGTGTLSSGISSLQSGTAQLTSNLQLGSETLKVNLVNSSEDMGDFISAPIATKDEIYGQLNTYAQGFSPLFMSLGLWVGALLLFFVVPARSEERLSATAPQVVFSGLITASIFGVAEALVIVTGALIVGIDPLNILTLYLFAIFVSFAFITIIQCFSLLFGLGGKIIGILLTIFQIPACGGTFPVQLMPSFFEKISAFLPMTYSIDGFREILSGENLSTVWYNVSILTIFLLSFLVISLLLCNGTKRMSDYLEGEISR